MPKTTTTMIDRVSDTKVLCGNNLWSAARGATGLHKMTMDGFSDTDDDCCDDQREWLKQTNREL